MIPGNKHILLKTSFPYEIQQVIWVIWLKTEKMELVNSGHFEFWYLDSSKYTNCAKNGLPMPHLVGKVILHGFLWPFTFKLHFQYDRRRPSWILMAGLVKIQKNDARNGFSMPKLVGKVVLHSFRYHFVFKLHFQYSHRQPFWILASHKFRRHFREGHGG